jgi:glycosyltransferase involved in cell wall biosynthesis
MDDISVIRYAYFFRRWETLAAHGGGILSRLKSNPLYYFLLPFLIFSQLVTIIRLLRRNSFDIIHAHWLIPQGLLALLACRLTGRDIPVVLTSHGGDLYALNGWFLNYLKHWVMKQCRHLTVVSEAMRSSVIAMGLSPLKVSLIPMGVDLVGQFKPDRAIQRNPAELLFVGRLVEKKGVLLLIEAMPLLLHSHPSLRLRIAGDGPLSNQLRQRANALEVEDHCEFLGMVYQEKIPSLLSRATIFIAPFQIAKGGDQEGLGLVLVEAAGCECPIIAGDVPAVHDVINDGVNGLLINPGDSNALVNAVSVLLTDPQRRSRLGSIARKYCLDRFDWEIITDRYGKLLMDCANTACINCQDSQSQ